MKRLSLIVFLLLVLWPAAARVCPHRRVPRYDFARFERNALQFPGSPADFDLFLHKLDTLVVTGRGNVRILQVGGSHVQGGTWSDQLRRNLLAMRYGMDGGRGLVFPFAAAGTNTPSSYQSSCSGSWTYSRCLKPESRLGLTGMAVSTSDTAATVFIDLAERERRAWSQTYMFRSVDVLGYGSLEPVLVMGRDTVAGVRRGARWHYDLPHYADYVRVGFRGFPGQYTLTGLYLDRPSSGLTFSEVGVNGAATGSFLKCEDFRRDLALVAPDLVIFSIGINDIQGTDFDARHFVDNYARLVREVRSVNPHCAILFTTLSDSYRHHVPNRFGAEATRALYELASRYDAALWDLFDIMGGLGSIDAWHEAGLAAGDHVHFTPEGYRLLGDLLFNAIMARYETL